MDSLMDDAGGGRRLAEFVSMTFERKEWRSMIVDVLRLAPPLR